MTINLKKLGYIFVQFIEIYIKNSANHIFYFL